MIDCLDPFYAWQRVGDKRVILRRRYDRIPDAVLSAPDDYKHFELPCGKCILCKRRRAVELSIRARCEAVMYRDSCFITLTVDDDHMHEVFPCGQLTHRPFQLFMKRLRKRLGKDLRYLMCGEYGEETHRPHYHVILFGWSPHDGYFDSSGAWIASRIIKDVWPFGNHQCDDLNDNRICYVAGYTLKNVDDRYPSYSKWSRRPALGLKYFEQYWQDCYNDKKAYFRLEDGTLKCLDFLASEFVLDNRKVQKSVRYFSKKLQLLSPEKYDILHSSNEELCKLSGKVEKNEYKKQVARIGKRADCLDLYLARKKRDVS